MSEDTHELFCDNCGWHGPTTEVESCDHHADHGFCPSCNKVIMWDDYYECAKS